MFIAILCIFGKMLIVSHQKHAYKIFFTSHDQYNLTFPWVKVQNFQNPKLRNSKFKTRRMPTKANHFKFK